MTITGFRYANSVSSVSNTNRVVQLAIEAVVYISATMCNVTVYTTVTVGFILSLKIFHMVQAVFNFERNIKFDCNDPGAK